MNYEFLKVNSPEELIGKLNQFSVPVQTLGIVGWQGQRPSVVAVIGYEGTKTAVVSAAQPAHQAILWLAGRVFTDRNFAQRLQADGLSVVMKECPVNDLTSSERQTFEACMKNAKLQSIVGEWWKTYDSEREKGNIPSVKSPWY